MYNKHTCVRTQIVNFSYRNPFFPPQNWHNSVHYQKFTLCALITYEFSLTTVVVGHVIEKVLESHHQKKIKNTDLAFVSQSNSHASCFLLIYDQA